ncbi:DUF1801 domain-containing protein [Brevundimonas sp.]|uniref:DUF1801 domain-containing protein n=1 Tax=Brevundimonas sp. TaxID=1871086 RepID=UPI00260DF3F8|nr:DUF1801 domain-containing protein [Brevundimonas sp.]
MAEPKTRPTDVPVADFIAAVDNPRRRADAEVMQALLSEMTGVAPVMWGPSIIGYDSYKGPTGDWPRIGFSPRKAQLVLYVMGDFDAREALIARLGKVSTKGGCLYINRLDAVDEGVLRELVAASLAHMRAKYPD